MNSTILIFVNEINETQLITEMVSNGLPQVPNEMLRHRICQFCSVFFIKELGQTVKNHTMTIIF